MIQLQTGSNREVNLFFVTGVRPIQVHMSQKWRVENLFVKCDKKNLKLYPQ